jgi:hypothetical protein
MAGIFRPMLATMVMLLLGGGVGLFLGETTVDAMQVRRLPEAAEVTVNDGPIAQGRRWAQDHYPADADACPSPTLLFQWGCVMSSSN